MPDLLQARNIHKDDFFKLNSPEEKIAFLLQYAVLAPSTHNSQPWNFRVGSDFCEIIRNDENPIVYADPKGRDLYISFGCLIENLVVAARYFRVFKNVDYVLQGSSIARISFDFSDPGTNTHWESVIDAILIRVNARGLFEKESVDKASLDILKGIEVPNGLQRFFLEQKQDIATIADLTNQGLVIAYRDTNFRNEMSQWVNNSVSKKPTGIPGYSLRMPFLISFVFSWLVRNFNIGKRLGSLNRISINSAPAAIVVTADENTPKHWLETGRFAERFVLQTYALGYKTSFFTAAIEMGDLYQDIQRLLHTEKIPQFIIIFGKLNHRQKQNLRYSAHSKIIK